MASPSPTSFSFRGMLHSLFHTNDDDALSDLASPLASARTSRWSRWSHRSHSRSSSRSPSASPARSPSPWSARSSVASSTSSLAADSDDARVRPYAASRLDGEFNVWFEHKPLGLGLVPSTQLYGTWEVSAIATTAGNETRRHETTAQRGDVIIAVNFNTRVAKLPRDALETYLQQSACPVAVTLRRPALYGSFDSRAVSTAMFPASTEYRGRNVDLDHKTFLARAPSTQWRRSLQHELTQQKKKPTRHTTRTLTRRSSHARPAKPAGDAVGGGDLASVVARPSHRDVAAHEGDDLGRPHSCSSAELTPMGEYSVTFHDVPLRLVLAPSTRLYGSVEVDDPKDFAPLVQIGDVLVAVDGDPLVSKWPTEDIMQQLNHLEPPLTISFRRPAAYRQYLETYFKTSHAHVSSRSTATAMFPDSAEYKHHAHSRHKATKPRPPRRGSMEEITTSTAFLSHHRKDAGTLLTKHEWLRVSNDLNGRDQFKLWQSGAAKRQLAKTKKQHRSAASSHGTLEPTATSAFLTERHVHYLWAHLPEYLTCNDMELVYDTRRHGWNVLSFYAQVQDKGPTLLVVKDTCDQIFGAFSSTSWKPSDKVYGNGRCFVFSLRPQMKVYTWSGLDDAFMFGRRDAILMGGGKKGSALCVELDELRGFSHACETFDSPPLAPVSTTGSGSFEMENVEVWCFSGLRV